MSKQFVLRFVVILALVGLLSTGIIEFILNPEYRIIYWIFFVPIILAAPILTAVVLATDEELEVQTLH